MADLISRAAALDAIDFERKALIEQDRLGAEHVVVHHARRLIEELPAVDAVPIVRCGECRMRSDGGYCHDLEMFVGDNFYCAVGRRRESE